MNRLMILFSATLLVLVGCAQTVVKKNPGDHNRGIRYYRPKPYLLIQPTKGESKEFVSISLEYLPDFSEEYAITVRAGIGKNATKIALKDGWNLTQIDQDVDSQFDENVSAMANLMKAVAPGGLIPSGRSTPEKMVVRANNVPLGYYESVINTNPSGKKQLYGFRYVGFMPFAPCPVDVQGQLCADCRSMPIFGLVMVEGVMTFVPLQSAEQQDFNFVPAPSSAGSPAEPIVSEPQIQGGSTTETATESNIRTAALSKANELLIQSLVADSILVSKPDQYRAVTITLLLSNFAKQWIEKNIPNKVSDLSDSLNKIVKDEYSDQEYSAKLILSVKP